MEKYKHNSKEMQHLAKKIKFLDMPERILSFPPEELLQMLPINKSDNILDLGAGTGFLTIPASKIVDEFVYALNMDPKMLEIIYYKAQDEAISNIRLLKESIDNIPLPEDSIDIVLVSLILHEVKPLSNTLQHIKRVLKKGGYFLCFELEKKESSFDGPPIHMRIPSSTMEQEIINAGFTIVKKSFQLYLNELPYIIIVKK